MCQASALVGLLFTTNENHHRVQNPAAEPLDSQGLLGSGYLTLAPAPSGERMRWVTYSTPKARPALPCAAGQMSCLLA